jgi:hypothetical protein
MKAMIFFETSVSTKHKRGERDGEDQAGIAPVDLRWSMVKRTEIATDING